MHGDVVLLAVAQAGLMTHDALVARAGLPVLNAPADGSAAKQNIRDAAPHRDGEDDDDDCLLFVVLLVSAIAASEWTSIEGLERRWRVAVVVVG